MIGDLRVEPGRERGRGLDAELLDRTLQIAHRVHAPVRVDFDAAEEPVGVLTKRAQRVLGACTLEPDAEHAALDAELVHLLEQEAHRVVAGLGVRHVLEHVLRGELELFQRFPVAQVGPQELVGTAGIAERRRNHEVDHADVGRHRHGPTVSPGSPREQIRTFAYENGFSLPGI